MSERASEQGLGRRAKRKDELHPPSLSQRFDGLGESRIGSSLRPPVGSFEKLELGDVSAAPHAGVLAAEAP